MILGHLFRKKDIAPPPIDFHNWPRIPRVTVQLPLYNEASVALRLIERIGQLDYPKEFLEIQVLDDSTDLTCEIARSAVAQLREMGCDAHYLPRTNRNEFKAGALQAGLKRAQGEFLAVFDADFLPPPDFLKCAIPAFLQDEGLGMVQTRWGHLNREASTLTRIQSILLDAHFLIEHQESSCRGEFFQFNGSGGLWRRACIEQAGGWQGDSLTEDLDLSLRAYLKGWRFLFLPQIETPAELPMELEHLKAQQDRWAQGMVQTARKMLPQLRSSRLPRVQKWKAYLHLTLKAFNPLLLLLALTMPLAMAYRNAHGWGGSLWVDFSVSLAGFLALTAYYGMPQRELYPDWKSKLFAVPLSVVFGFGMSMGMTRSLLKAQTGRPQGFVRTPKYGSRGKDIKPLTAAPRSGHASAWELLLGMYLTGAFGYFLLQGSYLALFPLALFAAGFLSQALLAMAPKTYASPPAPTPTRAELPPVLAKSAVFDFTSY